MRELKRSIARHMMELHGVEQINKQKYTRPVKEGEIDRGKKTSYFALHWKNYLNPASPERKDLHKKLRVQNARAQYPRGNGKTFVPPRPLGLN